MRQKLASLSEFRALQQVCMAAREAEKRKILVCTICSDFGAPQKLSLTLFPLFPHLFPMK